jgi:hypothetical protein
VFGAIAVEPVGHGPDAEVRVVRHQRNRRRPHRRQGLAGEGSAHGGGEAKHENEGLRVHRVHHLQCITPCCRLMAAVQRRRLRAVR